MKGISYGVEVIVFVSVDMLFRHLNPLTSRQIEAERRAMTQYARRGGKIWVRLFPDKPVTVRPTESSYKRDSGKGSPEDWVSVVKPGRILYEYEMGGVSEIVARKAISIAAPKMPIRTQFIIAG